MRLKLGQRRRIQSAIRKLRMDAGVATKGSEPSTLGTGRRLQDMDNDGAIERKRALVALVTFVSEGKYFDRDRDPIALMNCFALEHGVPYYVESHDYGAKWYNKQHVLRKYLPHFEWLLYVDTDTYIIDRVFGYRTLLKLIATLDAGGYHIGVSELHHSGAGGLDAGAMLIKSSPIGVKLVNEWFRGADREYRNADNGYLHIIFLRWVLGSQYTGHCDHHLYKNFVRSENGTLLRAREYTGPTIHAYNGFFPCFYQALSLPSKDSHSLRMRKTLPDQRDGRDAWKPFYAMHWDEPGVLSCAYPRRPTPKMMASPISCRSPLIYHGKDVSQRFWRGASGCDANSTFATRL